MYVPNQYTFTLLSNAKVVIFVQYCKLQTNVFILLSNAKLVIFVQQCMLQTNMFSQCTQIAIKTNLIHLSINSILNKHKMSAVTISVGSISLFHSFDFLYLSSGRHLYASVTFYFFYLIGNARKNSSQQIQIGQAKTSLYVCTV